MTKVLVIEDDLDVRHGLVDLLELEGYEVVATENSFTSIQIAQEEVPDVILCDITMPGLDGYGVLSAMRQNPVTAVIPFIFLTAKAAKADLRQGMELGADDYLTKPFTGAELIGAISARLAKQEAIARRQTAALNRATANLSQLAYYDGLTGLPNQLLLSERFQQAVAKAANRDLPVAVLCLDLDQFRRVNDILSYASGDLLLKAVAERLEVFAGENNTVAYLSSDQFALILVLQELEVLKTTDVESAIAPIAQSLVNAIAQPFLVENRTIFLTVSAGVALYPEHGNDIDTLIRHADTATHQAKKQGGNCFRLYTPAQANTSDCLELEADLRYALERSQLQVYYQPQINLQTNEIIGAEALVRWRHPERGLVSPAEFIPLAESTGLIVPMGEWVLDTACQQAKIWQDGGFSNLQIAVNLSARQFNQPNLCAAIAHILEGANLNPALLDLELTESTLVQDVETAILTLKELRALGVRISIDDFGTGYSSLSYLQRFPFDTLKIDRCFVQSMSNDAKNAAITTAIIQMAHQLQLQVVAEGVETQAELAFLTQHKCDSVQGYLFSPPIPAETFTNLLLQQA